MCINDCLCVRISVCLSVWRSFCLFICFLKAYMPVWLFVCFSEGLSAHVTVYQVFCKALRPSNYFFCFFGRPFCPSNCFSVSLPACLPLWLVICLFFSAGLSSGPTICLFSACLSACLTVYLLFFQPVHMSDCFSVFMLACLPVWLFVAFSAGLSAHLTVCLFSAGRISLLTVCLFFCWIGRPSDGVSVCLFQWASFLSLYVPQSIAFHLHM